MNIIRCVLLVLAFNSALAIAEPASEISIKELLVVMQGKKFTDEMQVQLEFMANEKIQRILRENSPTIKQRQAVEDLENRLVAIIKEWLSWEKLEPIYIRIYKESFTEEEVIEMLAFYKTPAGQAVIYRMPGLMKRTMLELQGLNDEMRQKIQNSIDQFSAEMATTNK